MSVRRLAFEQPDSFVFTPERAEEARWWISKYPPDRKESAVIPLLWIAQQQEGWVTEPALRVIGEMLGMPRVRMLEVATFYTMFHLAPVGKHHLGVCGTTPCMLRGSEALKDMCRDKIGPQLRPTGDGQLSWEEMECLGACANAPVVAIDDYYYEDLTPEALEKLLEALRRGEKTAPGSAIGRQGSMPEGGAKTLTDQSLYDGSLAKPITLPNAPEPAS